MKTAARWRFRARAVRRTPSTAEGRAFILAACFSAGCSSTSATPGVTSTSTASPAADVVSTAEDSGGDFDSTTATATSREPDAGLRSASDDLTVGQTGGTSTDAASSGSELGDSESTAASPTSDAGVAESNGAGPLWLFSLANEGRLHNARDPAQRFTGVLDATQASPDARPWSKSGRRFAQVTSYGLTVYDVAAELTPRSSITLTGATAVLRWLGEDRVLVFGAAVDGPRLWLVSVDGLIQELGTTLEDAVVVYHALAPDDSTLVYSSPNNDAYTTHSLRIAAEVTSLTLGTYRPSPMLGAAWSTNSQWLTFGISGPPDGGIYLWRNGVTTPPTRVSPEGGSYTPFFGFSRAGTQLAFVTTSPEGASELRVAFSSEPSQLALLSESAHLAPYPWGPEEWLTYSDDGGGHLAQLAGGALQRELTLPGYEASCPLVWLDAQHLLFIRCNTDRQVVRASIEQTLTTHELAHTSYGLKQLGDEPCVITWTDHDLRLLATNGETFSESSLEATTPKSVAVSPSGTSVAWSEGGHVRWAPVDDCRFAAPPVLIDVHPTDVQILEFLTSP